MPHFFSLCYHSLVASLEWQIGVTIRSPYRNQVKAPWLRKVAKGVLSVEKPMGEGEVSLVITGDEEIRELNRRYHEMDAPTDVLSFPLQEKDGFILPAGSPRSLGEVIISYPRAVEQAKEFGHNIESEMALLTIHGLLHLMGYDHAEAQEEGKMREKEATILRILGYFDSALAKHYQQA